MPFSEFDHPTRALLKRSLDAAWAELAAAHSPAVSRALNTETTVQITRQLLAAAQAGERDFDKLKTAALEGIARR